MSEDVKPYGAADYPAAARAEELRGLLWELDLSQREAGEILEVESRSIRRWSSEGPPYMALLALRYLLAIKRDEISSESVVGGRRMNEFAQLMRKPNALAPKPNALAAGSRNSVMAGLNDRSGVVHKEFASDLRPDDNDE